MRPSSKFFLILLLFSAACRRESDPVRATLDRVVKAAQARDSRAVVENLTTDYRDAEGQSSADVGETLRRVFAAYEIVDVRLADVEIDRAPEAARVTFRAEFSGQPRKLGGLDQLFPVRLDLPLRRAPRPRRRALEGGLRHLGGGRQVRGGRW